MWESKAQNNPQVSQFGVFDPNVIFIEDKFMRREFVEFNETFPDKYSHQKDFINSITLKLRKKIVDLQLKYCPAGSENWHKLQQRYSLLSTSNADTSVRSYFIEKSIKYSGGKLYICPHSIINAIQLSIISVVFCHREPLFFMPKNFKNITKNS